MKGWLTYLIIIGLLFFSIYKIEGHESIENYMNSLDLYFLIVLFIPLFISLILSFILFRKLSFKERFSKNLVISSFILLIYVGFYLVPEVMYILETRERFRNYALEDIKNDKITFRDYGLPIFFDDNYYLLERKKDSIRASYGVYFVNDGCTYSNGIESGLKLYDELVEPHLEERNGKDWRIKMMKEIENLDK